jgi:hypothetical protein
LITQDKVLKFDYTGKRTDGIMQDQEDIRDFEYQEDVRHKTRSTGRRDKTG